MGGWEAAILEMGRTFQGVSVPQIAEKKHEMKWGTVGPGRANVPEMAGWIQVGSSNGWT